MATPRKKCHIDLQPWGPIKTLTFLFHHLRYVTNLISKPKPKSLETNRGVSLRILRKWVRFSQVCTIFLDDYNVLWGVLFIHKTTNTTIMSIQRGIPLTPSKWATWDIQGGTAKCQEHNYTGSILIARVTFTVGTNPPSRIY